MKHLVERFLHYVTFNTKSNPKVTTCPSSPGQLVFAQHLQQEMINLGLSDVVLTDHGYLMARLPSNVNYDVPAIGFIAHMDTAPDASGKNVSPQFVEDYQGGDIALGLGDEVLSPVQYPDLHQLHGHNLITTNGKTLLGADNKAGIAEILSAIAMLIENPDIPHGDICIGFTPDEEIGRGADKFDVEKFGAQWAYTVDGGPQGELEYENFNAAAAAISIMGRSVHPGTAKDTMINSITLARELDELLPSAERPEHTSGYEGFFHLYDLRGTVEETDMKYIIRDHDPVKFSERKKIMNAAAEEIRKRYSSAGITLAIKDQYFNMKEIIEANYHTIEAAIDAYRRAGIEPVIKPVRGGTDGAKLSFMGLPCPNLFTGGHNYHGRYEYIPLQSMEKAVEVIINLCTSAKKPQK